MVEDVNNPTPEQEVGTIETDIIKLVNQLELTDQLTDVSQTGLFKQTRSYQHDVGERISAGLFVEAETLNQVVGGLLGKDIADKTVGEDLVTEVGIWLNGEKGAEQYVIRSGDLWLQKNGGKNKKIIPTTDDTLNIRNILETIRAEIPRETLSQNS